VSRFDDATPPAGAADAGRPLVSFVMPAWSPNPDWLRAAIEGVLAQRDCELELLVVDDGSPQPIARLLADVSDSRVRVIETPHGGTSQARNVGFAHSRGDWIRFVDSDDVLPAESTARLLATARRHGVVAYGATAYCDEDLRPHSIVTSDVQGHAAVECLLGGFLVTLPALLFPRWVVERAGAWDESIAVCQDWDFVLRALEHAHVRGDHDIALYYRQHPGGASKGELGTPQWHLAQEGRRTVIERYFERHPDQRGTRLERRARTVVDLALARGHREAYLAHLGRVFSRDPTGAVRELAVFARLVAGRALERIWRRGRSSGSGPGVVRVEDGGHGSDLPATDRIEGRG
jgi:glycosyltransferase involved in cell wall biosynthesis